MTTYAETYRRSLAEPEEFWAEAAEAIDWEKRWDRVLDDRRPPFYRWFAGAISAPTTMPDGPTTGSIISAASPVPVETSRTR